MKTAALLLMPALMLALVLSALAAMVGEATGAAIGQRPDPYGYDYALFHGQVRYAILGKRSGVHACKPGVLYYSEGGTMLCQNGTETMIPRPYTD